MGVRCFMMLYLYTMHYGMIYIICIPCIAMYYPLCLRIPYSYGACPVEGPFQRLAAGGDRVVHCDDVGGELVHSPASEPTHGLPPGSSKAIRQDLRLIRMT